ncbi:MAG TPA: 1,2-phenylacetyl-CoA epoxidase subunit PaaE [Caulobacteraceae bacterium]|nr:1,2-phenylacetyl-CoA epoxidase subunit PaaE [Caulobacteraceae bacterium]
MSTAFHPLRIAEIRRETADAVSLKLEVPPELQERFRFAPGQHLTLRAELNGEDVRRNYSVCVGPNDGELRVAVKQIAGGVFSTWVNTALKPGDRIEVMAPHGSFTWRFDSQARRAYAGFAGGSGITPILSLMKTALSTEPGSRFTLFYGNRSTATIMFLEELAALKNRFLDRLEVYHFLEDEAEEIELFNGRLDAAKAAEVISSLIRPQDVDAFFVCGPGPMMDAVEQVLTERGVAADKILIERFTVGRPTAAQAAAAEVLLQRAAGLEMTVTLEGRRVRVAFDPEKGAILDNAREAGLPAPFACKAGVCATCRARVVSGTVEMKTNYGLSAEEVAQGYVLTCQAVPTSEGVAVDYDA